MYEQMVIIETQLTGDFKEDDRTLTMKQIMTDDMEETMTTGDNGMIIMNIGSPEVGIEIGTYLSLIHI